MGLHEINQAVRTLRRRPGYTTVTIMTFGLGVGAAAAVFSGLFHVVLDPLPFPDSERLVEVWETRGDRTEFPFSIPNYESVRAGSGVFEELAAWMFGDFPSVTLTGVDRPERIPGALVTGSLFDMLRVPPQLGGVFTARESEPGNHLVVVLSHALWVSRFGEDPDILGRSLTLNGEPHQVLGVMPPGFDFPVGSGARLWRPLPYFDVWATNRGNHLLTVTGRLRQGVSRDAAARSVEALGRSLAAEFPESNAASGIRIHGLRDAVVGGARPTLLMLMGAVMVLWLITATNLSNLLTARVLDRSLEFAVRRAQGATRWQVARVVLIEGGLTAAAGTAVGLGLALLGIGSLSIVGPSQIPRMGSIALDGPVLAFALALSFLTAIVSASVPVLAGLRRLRGGAMDVRWGATADRGGRRLRGALVVSEFALAYVLLVASGLLLMSFVQISHTDPGFRAGGLLTAEVNLAQARYPNATSRVQFYGELMPALRALPGVESVAAVSVFPLSGNPGGGTSLHRTGATEQDGFVESVAFRVATPGYFETIGLPLLSGRAFSPDDTGEQSVAVVNQTLAEGLWPGEDPVGRTMLVGRPGSPRGQYEVVGLVADLRGAGLNRPPRPHIYRPYPSSAMQEMVLVVRAAAGPPADLIESVRAAVSSVDADQPLSSIFTGDALLAGSVALPRFNFLLLGFFSVTAVVLSAVGIFGVMSHVVRARTRELGVRMALGADGPRVMTLTMGVGLRQTALGIGIGIMLALAGVGVIEGLLFGVGARDPAVFAAGAMLLGLVALLSTAGPSWRAARLNPVRALGTD